MGTRFFFAKSLISSLIKVQLWSIQLSVILALLCFPDLKEGLRALGCHLCGPHSARLDILLLFQKNPGFILKQPYNLLLWAYSWPHALEEQQARFQNFHPSLFPARLIPHQVYPFFNAKHRISAFQISIRQFNHELNVSYYWSKAVLRHLTYKEDCQMDHGQPFLPNL